MSIEHEQHESPSTLPEYLFLAAAILDGVAAVTEGRPLLGFAGVCFLGAAALYRDKRKNSES